jgi:hypothetical protein
MSTNVAMKPAQELDGFDTYEDGIEGTETPVYADRGDKIKFTLDFRWIGPSEEEIVSELIAFNVERLVQKWIDQMPVETIVLGPNQKFPDIDAMNAQCPKEEWREAFGKMVGPWAGSHIVRFVDLNVMRRYWWPSPITTGGSARCVRELTEQIKLMRKFRGLHCYPVVKLSHVHMPTQFGGRERPYLDAKRWVLLGTSGVEALPPPASETPTPRVNLRTVEPPSAKEVTDDSIPY